MPPLDPTKQTLEKLNLGHNDNDKDNDNDNENIFIAMNYSKQSVQETSPMISCFTNSIHFT